MTELEFDVEKNVYLSLRAIEEFHKEKAYKIKEGNNAISGQLATIEKRTDFDFQCKILCTDIYEREDTIGIKDGYGLYEEIQLINSDCEFSIRAGSVKKFSHNLSTPHLINFPLTHFQQGASSEFDACGLRLIIPVSKEILLTMISYKKLKIGSLHMGAGLVEITIDELVYEMFRYSEGGKQYLFIDCPQARNFANFRKSVNAIITAYSLLSGNLWMGEYYYQSLEYDANTVRLIYYEKLEPSAITDVKLLDHVDCLNYMKNTTSDRTYDKQCIPMQQAVFANLCRTIKHNPVYCRCVRLIVEGHQSQQALLRAGIYSIAMETIAGIINDENEERVNPIPDKALAKRVKNVILEGLKTFESTIDDYGMKILEAKISNLNSPTNSKKLSTPFELYGIAIPEEDLEILNTRNKFLHGTSPFEEHELDAKSDDLNAIINRLLFMVMVLMLKYIGYNGHIKNYSSWVNHRRRLPYKDSVYLFI